MLVLEWKRVRALCEQQFVVSRLWERIQHGTRLCLGAHEDDEGPDAMTGNSGTSEMTGKMT